MKYMGSKSRIAKYIVPIIQGYIDKSGADLYIEPFVGGANVIDKIKCKNRIGGDKNQYHSGHGELEDWQIGNIGFLASYNGRFFDGGYAKSGYEKTQNGERYRDYYRESRDNLLQQSPRLRDIMFISSDYLNILNEDTKGCVFYSDSHTLTLRSSPFPIHLIMMNFGIQ